jgi:hypothetical protein
MPIAKAKTPNKYAEVGKSPRIERFGFWSKDVIIKSIAVGGNLVPTTLLEGTILSLATNGYWYLTGVTPPGGATLVTPAVYCVLVDSVNTLVNESPPGTFNPVSTTGYFSGNFLTTFLKLGGATTLASITTRLRELDLYWEHASAVTDAANYGTGT